MIKQSIMGKHYRQTATLLLQAVLVLTAAGCATGVNLQVKSQVPIPLVTQLPLTLGVYYNENFREYVYVEDSEDRKNWVIDDRQSRMALFNQILPSMFRSVHPVNSVKLPESRHPLDAIIEPDVVEMQLALPSETQSQLYEAWVKYHLKMYHPGGDLISQWEITGYGKSQVEAFSGTTKGLNAAIEMAMRDAGAKISLGFPTAPGIQSWLSAKIDCSQYIHLC